MLSILVDNVFFRSYENGDLSPNVQTLPFAQVVWQKEFCGLIVFFTSPKKCKL